MDRVHRVVQAFWGNIRGEELKKFSLLALASFFLIGSYWPLRTLKDIVFINMVGSIHQPMAKTYSALFLLPLVLIYSAVVHYFRKENLIYALVTIYSLIGLVFVYLLNHPTIGLENMATDPSRLTAWAFYLYVESFNSLMIGIFWSFINDVTTPESAKKGYGLIIFGTQLGGTITTSLSRYLSSDILLYSSMAPLIALISIGFFILFAYVIYLITKFVNPSELQGYISKAHINESKEKSIGFFDGIFVILRQPYIAGIFGLIFFHEVVATIMEYLLLSTVEGAYALHGQRQRFLFDYAVAVQVTACLFGLFGTSFFQRHFSIAFCLVAYPVLLGGCIAFYMAWPTPCSIAIVMVVAKALHYAFSEPTKEILYIPTSKNTKYRAKAWIDMFGQRCSKAVGAQACTVFSGTSSALIQVMGTFSLILIVFWALLGNAMGRLFAATTKNNEIIE